MTNRGARSLFLDLYHTSGKFRLVQRQRPRRVPGRFKPRAQPARKEDQCASSPQPQRRPTKIVLAVLPLETSDAKRQENLSAAPRSHARRKRRALVGLQDPPGSPLLARLATEPPAASRLPKRSMQQRDVAAVDSAIHPLTAGCAPHFRQLHARAPRFLSESLSFVPRRAQQVVIALVMVRVRVQ